MNGQELAACLNKRGRKQLPVVIALNYTDQDGAAGIYWGEVTSVGLSEHEVSINGQLIDVSDAPETKLVLIEGEDEG